MRRLEILSADETISSIGKLAKAKPDQTKNPVEILVATALAMRQRWYESALPRLQRFKQQYPNLTTFSGLQTLIASMSEQEFCHKVFNIRITKAHFHRYELLKDLVHVFTQYKEQNFLNDDYDALSQWASNVNIDDLSNDPIGQIHNVGLATVQNIRLLTGIDTVKPDIHVKNALKHIGLGNEIGIVELLSELTGYSCRELDLIFWYWGRSQSRQKMP